MVNQKGIKKIIVICAMFICISYSADAQRRRPITLNTGSGYITINELTGGYGLAGTSSDFADYFYGFTTTHGYQWTMRGLGVNQSMNGAMGAGIMIYESGKLFPFFGDIRFTINRTRVSPYFMACLRDRTLGKDGHDGCTVLGQRNRQRGLDHGAADLGFHPDLGAWILWLGLPHARRDRICRLDSS